MPLNASGVSQIGAPSEDRDICEGGGGGFLLPAFHKEEEWSDPLRAVLYGVALVYFFIGVSIIADMFMGSIEVITSRRRQVVLATGRVITVRVWNDTVANLTLMALGSSAPEILLAVTELLKRDMYAGELGPSTIVGSASFNLLVIIALCMFVIPSTETRRVREVPVFIITVVFMLFAYAWIVIVISFNTPNVVDIWEAVVTLGCLPILVLVSYLADIGCLGQISCSRRQHVHITMEHVSRACELLGSYDRGTKEALRLGLALTPNAIAKLDNPTHADIEDLRYMVKQHGTRSPSRAARRIEATRRLTGSKRVAWDLAPTFGLQDRVGGLTGASIADIPLACAKGAGPPLLQFGAEAQCLSEDVKEKALLVVRTGDVSQAVTVGYTIIVAEKSGDAKPSIARLSFGASNDGVGTMTPNLREAGRDVLTFEAWEDRKTILVQRPPGLPKNFAVELVGVADSEEDGDASGKKTRTSNMSTLESEAPKKDLGPISKAHVSVTPATVPGKFVFAFERVMIVGTEEPQVMQVMVLRQDGCSGRVTCTYRTERLTAVPGFDYVEADGELVFEDGVTEQIIDLEILPKGNAEAQDQLLVVLEHAEGGAAFEPRNDGGADSEILTVHIAARSAVAASVRGKVMNWLDHKINFDEVRLGNADWCEQFVGALYVNGSAEEQAEASASDWVFHVIALPWKICFTLVPPTTYCSGWVCFWCSLIFIGCLTALIGDLAELFGCVIGLPPIVTAITFVALGTSMPDLFASKTAATQDPFADASIVNVTGSNSVNVFLGLGLPWTIGSLYWRFEEWSSEWESKYPDHAEKMKFEHGRRIEDPHMLFVNPQKDLGFSVCVFSFVAVLALVVLSVRRHVIGAELGGPFVLKAASSMCLVALWVGYVLSSSWWALRESKAEDSERNIVLGGTAGALVLGTLVVVALGALKELTARGAPLPVASKTADEGSHLTTVPDVDALMVPLDSDAGSPEPADAAAKAQQGAERGTAYAQEGAPGDVNDGALDAADELAVASEGANTSCVPREDKAASAPEEQAASVALPEAGKPEAARSRSGEGEPLLALQSLLAQEMVVTEAPVSSPACCCSLKLSLT